MTPRELNEDDDMTSTWGRGYLGQWRSMDRRLRDRFVRALRDFAQNGSDSAPAAALALRLIREECARQGIGGERRCGVKADRRQPGSSASVGEDLPHQPRPDAVSSHA